MYTKGEWEASETGHITVGNGFDMKIIAEVFALEKAEANAHLISASPKTYEWMCKVISQGIVSPNHNKELYNEAVEISNEIEGK